MATAVNELIKQQTASKDREQRRYTRIWQVIFDSLPTYPAKDAENETGIPSLYDQHPDDAYAKVVRIGASQVDQEANLIWLVKVDYETPKATEWAENPLNDDEQITWGFNAYTIAVEKDKDGDPVLNSANDRFDPPLEQEKYLLTVTVVRNVAAYDPDVAVTYIGAVNDASETIVSHTAAKRTARCLEWSAGKSERNGTSFWAETIRIEFDPDHFDREVLDQGILCYPDDDTVTFTADPATDIVTFSGYTPINANSFRLSSSGTLPAGLSANTVYYAVSSSGSTCKLSASIGGTAIDITDAGSGTHSATSASILRKKRVLVGDQPADTPQRLDGNGRQLADGASPVFQTFRTYPEKDFATLDLDI